ncbi:hypothetical protein [Streptosporangium sp. NPDC002524]|uniref:hypothetical protein n=1 Tax=Streptosporangium sp. NPDC002524 TaxID=3154537 RepID=UPI0033264A82
MLDQTYHEEFAMFPAVRHAVLAVATATATAAAAFAFAPSAHAAAPAPQDTCQNGPFESNTEREIVGTHCRTNDNGVANQVSFSIVGSTYTCDTVDRMSPGADGSFAVIGNACERI